MTARAHTPGAAARNGLPLPRHWYTWRARRVPWMVTALQAAEREHGPPRPTCVCGEPFPWQRRPGHVTCPSCGHRTWAGP